MLFSYRRGRIGVIGRSILAGAALVACTVQDPVTTDPLTRNLQWFSYVGGDDLRETCRAGAPARYRFVYNAVWEEQVRTYELERLAPGQGALLTVRVIRGAPRLLQAYVVDSAAVGSSVTRTVVPEADYVDLIRAVEADGFGRQVRDGTRLESYDFYWLVNACAAGAWHLHAWRREDPGFADLAFAKALLRLDRSGIPVNPVRPIDLATRQIQYGDAPSERGRAANDQFQLIVRGGRLWGHARLF